MKIEMTQLNSLRCRDDTTKQLEMQSSSPRPHPSAATARPVTGPVHSNYKVS